MGGPEVERLIGLLARLPGLGPRSARRAVLRMLQQPESRMLPLAAAIGEAARAVRACGICTDPERDQTLVCVVEGVGDLWALERGKIHRGRYHVLGGTLSALGGTGPDDLNTAPLLVAAPGLSEVILALGASVDGAATAHWLAEQLRRAAPSLPISRVGQGVPFGGALDVLDDGTLAAALKGRRSV
jgi:recombination protein RecR